MEVNDEEEQGEPLVTLLFDDSLDFCDKHPRLCKAGEIEMDDSYYRYEPSPDDDKPEFCQI
jgi:hypothetical protein